MAAAKAKPFLLSAKELAASLSMPKTNFSLRPDHEKIQDEFRRALSVNLYRWQDDKRRDAPLFHLQDGPPFANGDLHIGHAMNKILKDILVRYKLMNGYRIRYTPGWDCHGLPIEIKALQEQRTLSDRFCSVSAIRRKCQEFALQAVQRQKNDMLNWGLLSNVENPNRTYLTLSPDYEARQLRVFSEFVRRGLISVGYRPVHWSPSSQTALAEAELEYIDDHQSTAAFVRFPVINSFSMGLPNHQNTVYLLIWTTTPWTLPANKAIAFNPSLQYVLVKDVAGRGDLYIVGKGSLERLPFAHRLIQDELDPQQLSLISYSSPMDGETRPVLAADFVTEDTGTGLVHIAPAYGMEDYQTFPVSFDILNDNGTYSNIAPPFLIGKHIFSDGSAAVLDYFEKFGFLVGTYPYLHRIPVDWRTKEPVIQRATRQLFIKIDAELKESVNGAVESIQFYPPNGKERLKKMIGGRREWCISRQRKWGVPVPIFYNRQNEEPLLDPLVINHVANQMEKAGSNCWWDLPVKDLLPLNFPIDPTELKKGEDTMDVWFDSGTAWSATANSPADVYLEGVDQFRGWFQSSLITSLTATGKAPFKTVISHGFVVDAQGNKMSKSIGNIIPPSQIINKPLDRSRKTSTLYGIDLLRAWAASTDISKDAAIGPEIMGAVGEIQQKIRNTCRFMLGNLFDYSPPGEHGQQDTADLWLIDRLLLSRTEKLARDVHTHYEAFALPKVIFTINEFCSEDLSAFYFVIVKDRLYSEGSASSDRQSAQFALNHALSNLTRLFAPILMFLAEEIYQNAPHLFGTKLDCIFQLPFPTPSTTNIYDFKWSFDELKAARQHLHAFISAIPETKGSSGQMSIILQEDTKKLFNMRTSDFLEIFGLSQVLNCPSLSSMDTSTTLLGSSVGLRSTSLHKCPRCWMYYSPKPDTICSRCESVINALPRIIYKDIEKV